MSRAPVGQQMKQVPDYRGAYGEECGGLQLPLEGEALHHQRTKREHEPQL